MILSIVILYIAVVFLYALVVYVGRRINTVLSHAESVLRFTEQQNKVGSSRDDRVVGEVREAASATARAAAVAAKAATIVQDQVAAVPDKVVEKLRGGNGGASDSGNKLPTVGDHREASIG